MFELIYTNAAKRYFKKIKEKGLQNAYKLALQEISTDPYCGIPKKGDLNGLYGYDVFYHKTNYEIAYRIYEEDGKTIVVVLAGTRENFYEEVKQYIK